MTTTEDFELTNASRSGCINFTTSSNGEIDGSMFQTLTLMARDIPVRYALREATVEVTDENGKKRGHSSMPWSLKHWIILFILNLYLVVFSVCVLSGVTFFFNSWTAMST